MFALILIHCLLQHKTIAVSNPFYVVFCIFADLRSEHFYLHYGEYQY